MKIIYILVTIFLIASCKCKKDVINQVSEIDSTQVVLNNKMTLSNCPENGTCTIEIFKNQSLDIKSDEFGGIYYDKAENPDTSIILYSYNKNIKEGIHDGGYREDVVFEIKNSDKEISLSNENLQNTKMLFGRFCFCRGQTGNYKVTDGNLKLSNKKGEIQIDLNYNITKVPQLIKGFNETIKL
jgi:hypothetical protein